MSSAGDSSSSTELVAGCAVERPLGERIWEAVQPELGRRVALRLLDTPFDARDWPEHRGVVDLLTVVETPEGTYVATRFVAGARTLAERRAAGARAADIRRWVDEAAATLKEITHGDLTEHDILIGDDNQALVTGFGRSGDRDDAAALARMRPRARRRALLLAPLVAGAAAVAVVLAGGGGDGDGGSPRPAPSPAPPVTAGATALGSALGPAEVVTADCGGQPPSGGSLSCTLMQSALPGHALVTPSAGVVRAWAVRGVRGRVALQLIEPEGTGFRSPSRTTPVRIDDPDTVRVIKAGMEAPKGARFALQVDPGTGVGVRRGTAGARTRSFTGPLHDSAREPDQAVGQDQELLLRIDFVPDG